MFDRSLVTESRFASALKKELTPLELSSENQSGRFVGSEGNIYQTTLDSCTCADFAIQGYAQPCKHMIRLAMEFNLISGAGKVSDPEAIKARYHLGKARQFIHVATLPEVIQFALSFEDVVSGNPGIPDDVFASSMDLASISDAPFFSKKKNGAVKIEKAWKKDWENILTVLRNRLGTEAMYRLNDPDFVSAFCK